MKWFSLTLLSPLLICVPLAQAQQTNRPFAPLQASATAGATVKLTTNGATSVPGTLVNTATKSAGNILITNAGTNAAGGDPGTGVTVFVRVSAEAVPTATAADIPLLPGRAIIVQNPVPAGTAGIAVVSTGTTNVDVFFTPGEGGQ